MQALFWQLFLVRKHEVIVSQQVRASSDMRMLHSGAAWFVTVAQTPLAKEGHLKRISCATQCVLAMDDEAPLVAVAVLALLESTRTYSIQWNMLVGIPLAGFDLRHGREATEHRCSRIPRMAIRDIGLTTPTSIPSCVGGRC